MEHVLPFFSAKPQIWNMDEEVEEKSEINDLIAETIARVPENSVTKSLGVDGLAKKVISRAIESIFRAIVLDYSNVFSQNTEEEIVSVMEDLQMQLIEILGCHSQTTTSEEFIKSCQSLFGCLNLNLELASNQTPKHLRQSIAKQVVEELVSSARNVINHHRCDYLCKIAKTCEYRDRLVERSSLM